MDEGSLSVLDRTNRVSVTREDILEYVTELAKREPADRDFEGRAILAVSLHAGNPDKSMAIQFRMEALDRLFGSAGPKGWTLPPMPDGSVPTAECVFAAAALQPIIENAGRPAFERTSFLEKVLELASAAGSA